MCWKTNVKTYFNIFVLKLFFFRILFWNLFLEFVLEFVFNNLYREIEGGEEHAMINIFREIEDMFVLKTCVSRSE